MATGVFAAHNADAGAQDKSEKDILFSDLVVCRQPMILYLCISHCSQPSDEARKDSVWLRDTMDEIVPSQFLEIEISSVVWLRRNEMCGSHPSGFFSSFFFLYFPPFLWTPAFTVGR